MHAKHWHVYRRQYCTVFGWWCVERWGNKAGSTDVCRHAFCPTELSRWILKTDVNSNLKYNLAEGSKEMYFNEYLQILQKYNK